jgi:hypothetical protein
MSIVCSGLACALAATGAGAQPPPLAARGLELGGAKPMVCVARDPVAWDAVKQAAGRPQMLPRGMPQGDDLGRLDGIDFQKQMIVAVFWGKLRFAGQGEKCWIDHVAVSQTEIVVDCRSTLWGGATDQAYQAWPYHAQVVARSDLPVRFQLTTEWKGDPSRAVASKTLAILKTGEWKREFSAGE